MTIDLTTGLVLNAPLQDGLAASQTYTSLTGANGTLTNAVDTLTSRVAGPGGIYPFAANLDGTNDHIEFGNILNLAPNAPFSLNFFAKPNVINSAGTWYFAVKQVASGAFQGWYLFRNNLAGGNTYQFGFFDGSGNLEFKFPCTNTTANRHVSVNTTGATGKVADFTAYENGILQTKTIVGDTWVSGSTSNSIALAIGASVAGANAFPGALAGYHIYTGRILAQPEVAALIALGTTIAAVPNSSIQQPVKQAIVTSLTNFDIIRYRRKQWRN